MKSTETIATRGRSIALEILNSADGDELDRIMELGLPDGTFSELVSRSAPTARRIFFVCDYTPRGSGLSGLRPQIFVDGSLSEAEQVAAVAQGTFELARQLYLDTVSGADRSDLDVWISNELRAEVRRVASNFIAVYGGDRSMLKIGPSKTPRALSSFTPLRKLVLNDG